MPRKSKDEELNIEEKTATTKKASTVKKASTARKTTARKKAATEKESTDTKKATATKATTAAKKNASTKKTTASKTVAKKSATVKETTATKKATTAKKKSATTKKTTTTRKRTVKKVATPVEYYDLPAVYNQTVVKILAQTPSCLFVYWEVSEKDKLNLQKQYGEEFFLHTKPYLVITNETMNYTFETEINDYANSWYIHINDSDCKYEVKLVRKPINHEVPISAQYVDIVSSNEMSAPNDHILFDRLGKTVFFRNVKTNIVTKKDISSLSFISNIGRIYNIYDLYKEIYKNELDGDELGVRLSSSQISSFSK